MNITKKIILTDTNIITDLSNANILKPFVELDNVYISDLIKYDEINSATGNTNIIERFKTINATGEQLAKIYLVRQAKPKLSTYDALNYIIAKDKKCILATGDKELKTYSENHGVEVIRTLRIIELMVQKNIISTKKAIHACELLKANPTTRIPKDDIDNLIKKYKQDSVPV